MGNILVTGATGFLGRSLVTALRNDGHTVQEISSVDGDITSIEFPYNGMPFTHVYHLAARTFVPESWSNEVEFHRVNVLGTLNILRQCRLHSLPLIYVSTYVYGSNPVIPITEKAEASPNNPYAMSKYIGELLCELYSFNFGLPITIVRPFNIYGPGQDPRFLIPSLVNQAINANTIVVQNLTPKRDYIYIDDVTSALILCLSHAEGVMKLNIGSGFSISVGDLVKVIQDVAGTNLPVYEAGIKRENEIDNVVSDISLAKKLLGWYPHTSLYSGIASTIACFDNLNASSD